MPRPRVTPLRLALLLGLVLSALRFNGCLYLGLVDARAIDYRLLQRGPQAPAPEVVVVAVDDASIEREGRWPWSRSLMGRLLDRIAAAEPAVIGFDIVQSEATAELQIEPLLDRVEGLDQTARAALRRAVQAAGSEDEALARAVRASGHAVLGYFFDFDAKAAPNFPQRIATYNLVYNSPGSTGERRAPSARRAVTNLPALTEGAQDIGYFNVIPDRDGSVRRLPLVTRYGTEMALPLALVMLRAQSGQTASIRFAEFGVESVQFGAVKIPVAADGQLLLNFRGPGRTFPHLSAAAVLAGEVAPDALRGKIVLVGVTATAVGDIRVTPFDGVYPGVEVHATGIDNVLRHDFIWQPKWTLPVEVGLIWLCVLVLSVALHYTRGLGGALTAALLLVLYLLGSQWLFVTRGLPLTLVYPILAISLTYVAISVQHYIAEEGEKRKTRRALELYLSPSMARLVSEQPERLKLGGEKRELTVLFSDIRGFTAMSEGLEPEELVDLLNVYLGEMTDAIFDAEGMLDKYIGDAVMAVWGAPLPQADHAQRACAVALEMQDRLLKLNADWRERGWPALQMGVGLNTGSMIFGNMGSTYHLSLTVMGDNVNLGSRLEGLCKLYGSRILASESTVRAAGESIVAREIDQVRVKGRSLPVRVFEVLAAGAERARWAPLVERFEAGLAAYRAQEWAKAIDIFSAIRQERPDDAAAALYIERCIKLRTAPPIAEWDGVTTMDVK